MIQSNLDIFDKSKYIHWCKGLFALMRVPKRSWFKTRNEFFICAQVSISFQGQEVAMNMEVFEVASS